MVKSPPHLTQTAVQEVLSRLANGLSEILGNQLVKVYLYGSYATGEAYYGSDIVISRLFISETEFNRQDSPSLMNVHQERRYQRNNWIVILSLGDHHPKRHSLCSLGSMG